MKRSLVVGALWASGCGGVTVLAPAPAATEEPVVPSEAPAPAEPVAAEAPAATGVAEWLAELARAASVPRHEATCVEVPVELSPLHVARCAHGPGAGASTSIHVGHGEADVIATIGALRIDEPVDDVRISARSATTVALSVRPRSYESPRVELVCSAPRARCLALPLGLEPEPDETEGAASGAARYEVTLEDTAEGTIVRVGGRPLSSSLAALADGAVLETLLLAGELPREAAPLDDEAVLARLFRTLHPTAAVRTREIVLVDDGLRRETLTLTEPRDQLVAVTLMGTMSDVYEQQAVLQLMDARPSGVAVLTSIACFESPSVPARGGRWPPRALGTPAPMEEPESEVLDDLPSPEIEIPDEREGWQVRRGTVCHGNLCSAVVLAGEPAFLATMGDILAGARFAPEAVSLTRRRACEGP